jgi:hypothetical protein
MYDCGFTSKIGTSPIEPALKFDPMNELKQYYTSCIVVVDLLKLRCAQIAISY